MHLLIYGCAFLLNKKGVYIEFLIKNCQCIVECVFEARSRAEDTIIVCTEVIVLYLAIPIQEEKETKDV